MEELMTKARQYAEGALKDCLTDALAKAFVDGYNAGIEDKEAKRKVVVADGETEYVDLGLPSGTLWAKDFLKDGKEYKYMSYDEAKDLSLPTPEQWEELVEHCKIGHTRRIQGYSNERFYCTVVGPNGNRITFRSTGYVCEHRDKAYAYASHFWLTYSGEKLYEVSCKHFGHSKDKDDCLFSDDSIDSVFSGYKLCVRLVKSK